KALSQQRIADENVILKEEIKSRFGRIIGNSQKIQKVYKFINKVADRPTPVLILGESGTGKELVAREIHERSSRRDFPFVAVNCAALAEGVLESELFGHEKGSFTGAHAQKKGRFEIADKGTLFLDEIGDLPLNTQVKLLRFLQEKSFERVGGTTTLKVDVRIIAATNKDLKEAIKNKTFREDLFYRLNVITMTLPPLRERREDIHELIDYFWSRYTKELHKALAISPEVKDILVFYDWPGNIRELENAIERIIVLSEDKIVNIDDLPMELREGRLDIISKALPENTGFTERVEYFEKEIIRQALEECSYNQIKTSEKLKINRGTLQYKIKKYNLQKI
ncbi:MAG: sigma-54-dependent Fis family transcriptional regulator, partial [Nitrospirae bacterium]|nr:sigma-54-dependent Fis family transcriptional regulator [Nitrospirota bacterium]